jgi:hypothetical protein
MDETKIYSKLIEHDERLERLEGKVDHLETAMGSLQNTTDKILHIVERLDQVKTVTSYRLDDHDARIGKLEQSVNVA